MSVWETAWLGVSVVFRKTLPIGGRAEPPFRSERLREPRFQEFSQLRRRPELRDGIQFLECGRERIRETPARPRSEFLVLRFVGLCCRQHKATYVAQIFMWRSLRDGRRDARFGTANGHIT